MVEPLASNSPAPPRIFLAEDEDDMRALVALWLRMDGYEVVECHDGMDLLVHLERSVLSGELADCD
jgi:DNA-binding response OmpR family regulator